MTTDEAMKYKMKRVPRLVSQVGKAANNHIKASIFGTYKDPHQKHADKDYQKGPVGHDGHRHKQPAKTSFNIEQRHALQRLKAHKKKGLHAYGKHTGGDEYRYHLINN